MADRARQTRHAAGDARPLKGGPRSDGAAEKAAAPAEGHFAVRARVQKEHASRPSGEPGREQTRRDVTADIPRDARHEPQGDTLERILRVPAEERFGQKRRSSEAAHAVLREEQLHGCVPGEDDLAQVALPAPGLFEQTADQRPHLRADTLRELAQAVRPLERILDAADDVGTVGRLRVPCGVRAQRAPVRAVIEPDGDGCRPEVDRGGAARAPRLDARGRGALREDRARARLRQLDLVAVRRMHAAGKARHAVYAHAALAAAAAPAAGGGEGIARAAQHLQQRFFLRRKGQRACFVVQPDTDT